MAGWLAEAKTAVKDILTVRDEDEPENDDPWNTWDYNPEKITAPAIAITYGSPALEDGDTFGCLTVRWVATLIPKVGTNDSVAKKLETLIETSVVRLLAEGYGIEQVGQPYMLQANNAHYFAVDIQITSEVEPE